MPGDIATIHWVQQVLRCLERTVVIRIGVSQRQVGKQCQGSRLGQDAVGRDTETRSTEHQYLVLQHIAIGQDELTDKVHSCVRSRKLHGSYLYVYRAFISEILW